MNSHKQTVEAVKLIKSGLVDIGRNLATVDMYKLTAENSHAKPQPAWTLPQSIHGGGASTQLDQS